MKCLYIPREINQSYVLLWKRDEAVFLMMPFIFIITIGGMIGMILTLASIIIVARVLKKVGNDKPNGYILHLLRYNVPTKISNSLFKRGGVFPSSHIRHIAG